MGGFFFPHGSLGLFFLVEFSACIQFRFFYFYFLGGEVFGIDELG